MKKNRLSKMCNKDEKGCEWMARKRFISDSMGEKCRTYVYRGEDRSILYNMFLSDFATTLLKIVPRSVSPNMLTLLGIAHSVSVVVRVASYGLMFFFCPEYNCSQAPRWVLPVCGICFFIYQTLDNMDGKQARRTKSSTALGLVFDHGCDSLNIVFGSVFAATLTNAGASFWITFITFANTAIPFYTATLEHYYVGNLILRSINGACEGVASGVLIGVSSYWVGHNFFWENAIFLFGQRVPLATVILVVMTCINFSVSAYQIYTIIASERRKKRPMLQPIWDITPFAFMLVLMVIWGVSSPQLFQSVPHAAMWLFGTLSTEILVFIMVAHVCHSRYIAWRPVLAPLPFAVANSSLFVTPLVDEKIMIRGYAIATVAMVAWNLSCILYELREALGIWVFSLQPRQGVLVNEVKTVVLFAVAANTHTSLPVPQPHGEYK